MSEYFHYDSSANQVGVCFAYNSQIWLIFADNTTATLEDFSGWITDNNDPYIWHVYATPPTDITITNQTLIDQLEAVCTALLDNGANTISNAATSPNLAGDMEVSYYGYDPQNQYNEWLYINNAWELVNDDLDRIPTKTSELTNDSGYITSSDISTMQTTSNLVTSISSASTDDQYPSAKLLYDTVGDIESALNTINNG